MDAQILIKPNLCSKLALNMHEIWSCRFKFIITIEALDAWFGLELEWYCLLLFLCQLGVYIVRIHLLFSINWLWIFNIKLVWFLISYGFIYYARTFIPRWNRYNNIGMAQNDTDPVYNSYILREYLILTHPSNIKFWLVWPKGRFSMLLLTFKYNA